MSVGASRAESPSNVIRRLDRQFTANVRAHDADALVRQFYTDDARLLPPNQPTIQGHEAITGFYRTIFNAGVSDIDLDTSEIVVSGDLAYGVGEYSMTLSGTQTTGKYVVIYRKVEGNDWRASVDIFTPNA